MTLVGADAENVIPPIDCPVLQPEPLLVALGHYPSHIRLCPGMLSEPRVGTGQYVFQDDVSVGRHLETNGWGGMAERPAQGVGEGLVPTAMSSAATATFPTAASPPTATAVLSLS
eukprot:CAMPEP_0181057132 /NCGR_PEP_ID=MMETSP1070-20121207/20082_1 /TAXON_ID=265543 /ORGANISM="Minutocellus polymorphus, Strain NH13" /LENGTH=114 /DNA_ID=CAMNT_0023136515 /DNA_START=370 /DNA_END=711 /DNA_ORIENTATION=+